MNNASIRLISSSLLGAAIGSLIGVSLVLHFSVGFPSFHALGSMSKGYIAIEPPKEGGAQAKNIPLEEARKFYSEVLDKYYQETFDNKFSESLATSSTLAPCSYVRSDVLRQSTEGAALQDIKGHPAANLRDIVSLVKAQSNGQVGFLLTNGKENIFFISPQRIDGPTHYLSLSFNGKEGWGAALHDADSSIEAGIYSGALRPGERVIYPTKACPVS